MTRVPKAARICEGSAERNPRRKDSERMKRIAFSDIELGPVLGTGTVGTVYQCRIAEFDEPLAVKLLQLAISNDELIRSRFRREMDILERLNHPHIIRYFGGGEHEGQLFYAMELLDRGNMRDMLDRFGQLSWQEVASIGRQVCSALQYAHNQGIIHRDLKPGNLFIKADANVKLGDFGIARDTQSADITSQGLTVGTHAYMSPEQITGESAINGQADLYSLGCVLFELLTGHKPFQGTNFAVLFEQHLRVPAPRVTQFVPDCPAKLADIIAKLLEKEPNDRPFNARAVQGVMHELLASDGTNSSGIPAVSKVPGKVPGKVSMDVAAAEVIDPGMKSMLKKLTPDERPQASWLVLIVLAICMGLVIALASVATR